MCLTSEHTVVNVHQPIHTCQYSLISGSDCSPSSRRKKGPNFEVVLPHFYICPGAGHIQQAENHLRKGLSQTPVPRWHLGGGPPEVWNRWFCHHPLSLECVRVWCACAGICLYVCLWAYVCTSVWRQEAMLEVCHSPSVHRGRASRSIEHWYSSSLLQGSPGSTIPVLKLQAGCHGPATSVGHWESGYWSSCLDSKHFIY